MRRAPRVAAMPGGHGDLFIPSRCAIPRNSKMVLEQARPSARCICLPVRVCGEWRPALDTYRPDFDLAGAVLLSEIVLGFGRWIANSPAAPTWNAYAEFSSARKPISE